MSYTVDTGVILWMTPELKAVLVLLEGFFGPAGIPIRITSGLEGSHGYSSLHYAGRAVDIEKAGFPEEIFAKVLADIRESIRLRSLPIRLEDENDHIHCEWRYEP